MLASSLLATAATTTAASSDSIAALAPLAPLGGAGTILAAVYLIVKEYRKGRAEAVEDARKDAESERKRREEAEAERDAVVDRLSGEIRSLEGKVEQVRHELRQQAEDHHRDLLRRDQMHRADLDDAGRRLAREIRVGWILREYIARNGLPMPDLDPDISTPKLPDEV